MAETSVWAKSRAEILQESDLTKNLYGPEFLLKS